MSGDESSDLGTASKAFLEHLEKTDFFQQINELEKNLKSIADDLKILGDATIQRMQETESLVAHVLAIESILTVMMRGNPVDADAVADVVKDKDRRSVGKRRQKPESTCRRGGSALEDAKLTDGALSFIRRRPVFQLFRRGRHNTCIPESCRSDRGQDWSAGWPPLPRNKTARKPCPLG